MANHRMFSNRIANSAKFLQMPTEAQLLYFHMILRADDDGVVESYPLVKLLGIPPDNFKLLILKGFIQQLNEDQVIVINDWLEHNKIRADRKVNSIYKHLLPKNIKTIKPIPRSDVIDNSKRVETQGQIGNGPSTDGISKVKLSKDKVRQDNLSEVKTEKHGIPEIIKAMESIDPKNKNYYGVPPQRKACEDLIEYYTLDTVLDFISALSQNLGRVFNPPTTPIMLRDNWVRVVAELQYKQQKKKVIN